MSKRVLDVGNCAMDHSMIKRFLTGHFGCEVIQADAADDALAALRQRQVDLVLVNRKLDVDYSDGVDVIRQIKAEPQFAGVPVMLVTNYPEHQQLAVQLGAQRGFGKLELEQPATIERLRPILS
ncbi:MAG: response regulator [Planctomycetota bacterium]|nr:MAG: response regulator [Planctomycetota bacterium]